MKSVAGFVWWLLGTDPFWSLFGTFIGALLGVPAGFWVNRWSSKHADRDRRSQLLSALRQTVDHNSYLIDQIEGWLNKDGFPFFNVDLPLLESTASLKYELLDISLCRQIDQLRYELAHLGRKVNLLLELEFDPSAKRAFMRQGDVGTTSTYAELHPMLVDAIKVHIPPIRQTLQDLKSKLPAD